MKQPPPLPASPASPSGAPVIQNTVIVNGAAPKKGCARRAFGCAMWILAAVAAAGIIAGIAGAGKKAPAPAADADADASAEPPAESAPAD